MSQLSNILSSDMLPEHYEEGILVLQGFSIAFSLHRFQLEAGNQQDTLNW